MTTTNPFGSDFALLPIPGGGMDFDPSMRVTTGRALLSQSLLCRQTTPRGSVIDCPNDCFDVRDWVNEGMTAAQIANLQATIQAELLKDARVLSATVQATYNVATSKLTITEAIQSSYGPFTLTLSVSQVTVQILDANLPTAGP